MNTAGRPTSGYTAWRLIAEELRADIAEGRIPVGARVPTEHELAERFGVNRHTVRRGVAALAAEGLVEARRGSGTFVTGEPVHVHRIGLRTRLSESLGPDAPRGTARVLDAVVEPAPPEIRERLDLAGEDGLRIELLRIVGGRPLSRGTHWFDPTRVPGLVPALRRKGSVTAALEAVDIPDYLRRSTSISARQATALETAELDLAPGAVLLVTTALDELPDGTPLHHVVTRFAAQRVVLDVEQPPA